MRTTAIFTLAFGVLTVTVYGQQQAPQATQTAPTSQTQNVKPTTPPDPTATTSTTPAPPAQPKEDKSVSANKQAQQSQLPQSDVDPSGAASLDTSGVSSAELQQKIQAALRSEPTLSASNLTVNVTDDEIDLSGTVGTGKERTTASRIVQSFGENRKVKEKINVSGVKK